MLIYEKTQSYTELKNELELAGYDTKLSPFEIGSRGHITKRNQNTIIHTLKNNSIEISGVQICKQLSKIVLLCSFSIFQAHCQPTWQHPPYLHP